MPAAMPPRAMLTTSMPKITTGPANRDHSGCSVPADRNARASRGSSTVCLLARRDFERLAGVFDVLDQAEHPLVQSAIGSLHDLGEVFIHNNVACFGIDRDRATRARVLPALEGRQRLVG